MKRAPSCNTLGAVKKGGRGIIVDSVQFVACMTCLIQVFALESGFQSTVTVESVSRLRKTPGCLFMSSCVLMLLFKIEIKVLPILRCGLLKRLDSGRSEHV